MKLVFSTTQGPKHSTDTMDTRLGSIFSDNLLQGNQIYEVASSTVPSNVERPFDVDLIENTIYHLPIKKTSGVDRLHNEMLKPIQRLIVPILLELFRLY